MSRSIRVLIIEDSENDTLLLVRELRRGGFEAIFERVDTETAMTTALGNKPWDLIIADYTMPQFSGIAALDLLRQSGLDIPFIIVSGSIGEDIAVAAMKTGAHDYLLKGNLQRLVPSIERELREAEVRRERRAAEVRVRRSAERIQALHDIDLAITSTLDLKAVLDILLEKIDHVRPSLVTTVRLFNAETGTLEPVACRNIDEKEWKAISERKLRGLTQIVLENKIPLTVANIQTDPRNAVSSFARKERLISYLGVPLIAKQEVLGLIAFYTREARSFTDDESEFLITLAGQAAIAIHNATLYGQVRKQMDDLAKSNQVKDEFLGVISHELRTPLNVSMGYAALLKDRALGDINPEQENAVEKVIKHTKDLLKLIDGVLCVRSLEANTVEVSSDEIELPSVIEELQTEHGACLSADVRLVGDCPGDLPPIKTDYAKLKQILQNLLDNAVKFTHSGQIELSVRYVPQDKLFQFTISDTGVGIAKDKLPIIFEMFRQVDSSKTRSYEGVGLGLYIVKRFTEMLGGQVAVESELGHGSAFTVSIPRERARW